MDSPLKSEKNSPTLTSFVLPPATFVSDPHMQDTSSEVEPDPTHYVWRDGTAVDTEITHADGVTITPQNVTNLSDTSFSELRDYYRSLLESSETLARHELWGGIQTRIFAVADRLDVSDDGTRIDVFINDTTPPAPYNRALTEALSITTSAASVGELRAKQYDGTSVLISGGVNNFIIVEEDDRFTIKLLTITRNVISNDGKTALADAGKAQSPGGGRLENAAALPKLAIDETAEEVHVSPALNLSRAAIKLSALNPTRMQVFVGEETEPAAVFHGNPYLDRTNNTLEGYANAIHFIGNVATTGDRHLPDHARLTNGYTLYRASEAMLLSLDDLRELSEKPALELTPDTTGTIDATILDHLIEDIDYRQDEEGNFALLRPIGLTPQLINITKNQSLMQWFTDLEAFMNTPDGKTWVKQNIAEYAKP